MDALRARFATLTAVESGLRVHREAHARRIQEIVAGLVLALVAALVSSSLFTARWTRRRLVAPLLQLRQVIERFDTTQSDPPRAVQTGFAEVGELAVAFNRMAGDLAHSHTRADILTAELAQQARTDALTGLANRRQFDLELEQACAAGRRYQTPLSLLSLDLDEFKLINDTHGHAAGDDALRVVASICRSNTRASDLIARVGGDEFAILMPQTARNGANTVAASIQQALINQPTSDTFGPLRVSVGVASASGGETDPHQLATAADAEMYANKRGNQGNRTHGSAIAS